MADCLFLTTIRFFIRISSRLKNLPEYNDETLSQILYVFKTMAHAADRNIVALTKEIPKMEGFQSLQDMIVELKKMPKNQITILFMSRLKAI